jgi:hypothetical protein
MKKIIILLGLMICTNSFASQQISQNITWSPVATTAITTGQVNTGKEEALQIINDSQDFFQTGRLLVFLNQKIKDLQSHDLTVSDLEAVEFLTLASEQVLEKTDLFLN